MIQPLAHNRERRLPMMQHIRLAFLLGGAFLAAVAVGNADTIETVAGTGKAGDNGREGAALEINIAQPFGVEFGPNGALYICEVGARRIRRRDLKSGRLTTVAGAGRKGYAGDGGPAEAALLNEPYEVRFDRGGNMFFVELQNHLVRRVDANTKMISTVAGSGKAGPPGDGGSALKAELRTPHSIAFDQQGGLLIADIGNHRIRRVDLKSGMIESIAGNGEAKLTRDGESARGQTVLGPRAMAVVGVFLWVALREGHSLWRLHLPTGLWQYSAGSSKGFRDGPGDEALFNGPKGIALDEQWLVENDDTANNDIREI